MLPMKLATVAAVGAIVAMGARFLPPPRPPLPPLPPYLADVHTLLVHATDTSEAPRYDASELSRAVARQFNFQLDDSRLRATAEDGNGPHSATLRITVLHKQAMQAPYQMKRGSRFWTLRMETSMEIVQEDGPVLWRSTRPDIQFGRTVKSNSDTFDWQDRQVMSEVAYFLFVHADDAVRPSQTPQEHHD